MGDRSCKLLYIAYYFPPLGGIASIRSMKYVKYLTTLGYDIQVLTVNPLWIRFPKDNTLLPEVPNTVKIWRSFCPDANWLFKLLYGLKLFKVVNLLRQRILIPDHEVLWRAFAKKTLTRVLEQQKDFKLAIISSGPPSSLALGLYLKNNHSIPFICDFRDEWTNNPERINLKYPVATQNKELVMEQKILSAASGIVYLTSNMQDNFRAQYPFLESKPSVIIPNGFDDSDFSGLKSSSGIDKFRLVYSGSFYDRRQPDSLWKALRSLIDQDKLKPESISVEIYGKNTAKFVLGDFAADTTITSIVSFHGFLPYRQSLEKMMQADALLLYLPSGKNAESVLTGKIFEYLRSGKPILAIVPPRGLAADIVSRARLGFVSDYRDISGIEEKLLELLTLWKTGEIAKLQPDWDYIQTFSRKSQASLLTSLIEETLASQSKAL